MGKFRGRFTAGAGLAGTPLCQPPAVYGAVHGLSFAIQGSGFGVKDQRVRVDG